MAEKGVMVKDAETGESIACRDAYEVDDDTNPRVIQRVDVCKGHLPDDFLTSCLIRCTPHTDSLSEANFHELVTRNLINVGDKSTLVVMIESGSNNSLLHKITPIIYGTDESLIGRLESKSMEFLDPKFTRTATFEEESVYASGSGSGSASASASGSGSGAIITTATSIFSNLMTWDVSGAPLIGLHITANGCEMEGCPTNVYGAVI